MTGKKGGDPVQRTIVSLEERVNVLGKAVFGSENFGKVMNTAVTTQARVQKRFSDRMAKNLHFYNMPSQEDVVQLAEQCGRIEERMVAIESMLHQLLSQKSGGAQKGPARTKKPKSATRSKKPDAT
ncbi:MAG: hypothetical protein NXH78_05265 [Hyphomonadaceae bacterium]|nr:hypothetical protein [Hyphomonadaceae bacterium]